MIQIFFISPNGQAAAQAAVTGLHCTIHCWTTNGTPQAVCVVHVGQLKADKVATALEDAGMILLPDHRYGAVVPTAVVTALAAYGVVTTDTTMTVMKKVYGVSGWPLHKPKRYS